MRLDKALADTGQGTRSDVRALIRQGRVTVDGQAVREPALHVSPAEQAIFLDGRDIDWQPSYTLMLHKPEGVVSSTDEPGQRTVLDLLSPRFRRLGLFPVGRLDKDTTGLLLLTSDGALAHRLMSPVHHVKKRYAVTVAGALTPAHIRRFAEGVTLADGTRCRPAVLEVVASGENSEGIVILREGKYHQIKRMMAACGLHVLALHRLSVGALKLDTALLPGDWRKLTSEELLVLENEAK